MIRLYNSLSRKLEIFRPIKKDLVGLYTCGPTVYNFAHIGNLRTYIFEDILQRTLEWNGYKVRRVMNITDVGHLTGDSDAGNDKVDEEARKEKKSIEEISKYYTNQFLRDIDDLNIEKPKILKPATEYVKEQKNIIGILLRKGLAYDTKSAVYFDVVKYGLKKYLRLSHQPLNEKLVGARGEVIADLTKRHPADFVLWFKLIGKFKNHILRWPSPWGKGFPGWHIECSAISKRFLGQPFDIHTGGVDHIGTHHTNEIAQSVGAFGKPLAKYWLHGEFLLLNKDKMAKSEGNFITLQSVKNRGINPLAFRYLVLQSHYRSKLNFSWESLEAARSGLKKIQDVVYQLLDATRDVEDLKFVRLSREAKALRTNFEKALNDDLDTPRALAVVQKSFKSTVAPREKASLFVQFNEVLGLTIRTRLSRPLLEIPLKIKNLADKREEYRRNKQFMQADRLRKEINALGYDIKDSPDGPRLWPKNQT